MSHHSRRRVLFRRLVLLTAIPLLLSGTTYALLSQNLAINATGTDPVYVATQYLFMSYTKTLTNSGGKKKYSIKITVRNNGATQITAWQVVFDMPSDWTTFVCATSVICSNDGVTETIANGSGNATIAAGGTRTFTITFLTALTDYSLQNIYISGTNVAGFQSISGLTVALAQGARTKVGSVYQWPITYTITNASGFDLSAWQITVPWTTVRSVVSLPSDVTYVVSGSSLLITSTQPISDGEVYEFSGVFGSTKTSWTIGGTIKGMP